MGWQHGYGHILLAQAVPGLDLDPGTYGRAWIERRAGAPEVDSSMCVCWQSSGVGWLVGVWRGMDEGHGYTWVQ